MRHQYTPIFSDVLASRIWAMPPAARSVWLWLKLRADPEGFVCATVAGVAIGANVTYEAARDALAELAETDADADPDDEHEGRIIMRVPRGWLVLAQQSERELAKRESANARQRRYAKRKAASETPANDAQPDADPPESDAPKPKPKPKPLPSEGESPLPPKLVELATGMATGTPVSVCVVAPPVLYAIPATWQPSESLRADAAIAGVVDFDERLASLRAGPIGGTRGVFEDQLDEYVRTFFGKWRTWAETDRARANVASKTRTPGAPVFLEPTGKHRAYAKKHGLDLGALCRELAPAVGELGARRALEMLGERMSTIVRQRGAVA